MKEGTSAQGWGRTDIRVQVSREPAVSTETEAGDRVLLFENLLSPASDQHPCVLIHRGKSLSQKAHT